MGTSFFSKKNLYNLGFHSIGENCLISKFARFYNNEFIKIGDNVRIDDFCILSGKISVGSYVHISAFSALYGSNGIKIGDFSGLSPRTTIFSATDDFSGEYLINPMIPKEFTNVNGGPVTLERYVQLGANTIVMPKILIGEGSVTGAFTFINKNLDSWKIYKGIPVSYYKERKKDLLKYVEKIK